MATLKDLGLSVDDYLDYIRGVASEEVNEVIDQHWDDADFPWTDTALKPVAL